MASSSMEVLSDARPRHSSVGVDVDNDIDVNVDDDVESNWNINADK